MSTWGLSVSTFEILNLINFNSIFSGADDVFVRKDILKTKYKNIDYAGVGVYNNWCNHWSDSDCQEDTPTGKV